MSSGVPPNHFPFHHTPIDAKKITHSPTASLYVGGAIPANIAKLAPRNNTKHA